MTNVKELNPLFLISFSRQFTIAKALQAVAELNIAEHLDDSPKTAQELADLTSTHKPSLYRLLRALASEGIFRETSEGLFENTPLSNFLREDDPQSVKSNVIYILHDGNVRAWMRLMDVLKTGEPSFKEANGCNLWDYLEQRPALSDRFNKNMAYYSANLVETILEACDFSSFESVIDIGGGNGTLMAGILEAYPSMHGAVFDLPSVVDRAKENLAERNLSDRCETIAGTMFEQIPAGYDAYLLKLILHDWSDDEAYQILRNCRQAIPEQGKLIIFDSIISPGKESHLSKSIEWIDLHMMVTLGGKERTAEEFQELLVRANFKMTKTDILSEVTGIVEAVPV